MYSQVHLRVYNQKNKSNRKEEKKTGDFNRYSYFHTKWEQPKQDYNPKVHQPSGGVGYTPTVSIIQCIILPTCGTYCNHIHTVEGKCCLTESGVKWGVFIWQVLCVEYGKIKMQMILWLQQQHECPKCHWTYTYSEHDDQVCSTNCLSCFYHDCSDLQREPLEQAQRSWWWVKISLKMLNAFWLENGNLKQQQQKSLVRNTKHFFCLIKIWLTK